VIITITFAGCATDSDPDRLSWDDVRDRVTSVFGKDASAMAQAKADAQEQNDDNAWASQKYLKR